MVDPYSSRAVLNYFVLLYINFNYNFNPFASAGIINEYSTATKMPEHLLGTERFQFLFKPEVRMQFDTKFLL